MNDWAADSKAIVANSLMVAAAEFAVGMLACYFVQLVRFFRRGETVVGVLCLLCLVLGGGGLVLGVPVSILFGWLRARRWGTGSFMALFTGLFVVCLLNFGLAVVIQKAVTVDEWAFWFSEQ